MNNQITSINLHGLSKNAIKKIFNLLEDKDLLRLREICHTTKNMVDLSILNVRKLTTDFEFIDHSDLKVGLVMISFKPYFEDGKRNYGLLNIALTHIMTELPFLNIKRNHNESLRLCMKPNCENEFLTHFQPRISGIQWRVLDFFSVHPDQICTLSKFFKGHRVESINLYEMIVENSDFLPYLELIRNVSFNEFECELPKYTRESFKFLHKIADIANVVKICSSNTEDHSNPKFVTIAKAMLSRKCSFLQFHGHVQLISQSELECVLKFLHQCDNRKMVTAFTNEEHYRGQIGEYLVETSDLPISGRYVAIYPIEEEFPYI